MLRRQAKVVFPADPVAKELLKEADGHAMFQFQNKSWKTLRVLTIS
jgi:hypothetical protein